MDKTIKPLLDYLAFDVDEAYRALNEGSNLLPLATALVDVSTELYEAVYKSGDE